MPTPRVDDLLAAVRSLPPVRLTDFLDGLAGMQVVTDAGWRVRERRMGHRRFAARDAKMLRRHLQGASYTTLAMDFGLSRSGAAKACQRARAFSVHLQTMSTVVSH